MQKIKIENFMALNSVEIELRSLLLLLGEQASGKSTISKLIYYFQAVAQELLYVLGLEEELLLYQIFHKRLANTFFDFFGSINHLSPFTITYYYSSEHYIKLSKPKKGEGLSIFISGQEQLLDGCQDRKNRIKRITTSRPGAYERAAQDNAIQELENFVNNWFENNRVALFIPAGRSITVNYPEPFKMDFYSLLTRGLVHLESQPEPANFPVDLRLMYQFVRQTEQIRQRFSNNAFQDLINERLARKNPVNENVLGIAEQKIEQILKGKYRYDQYGEKIFYNNQDYVLLTRASSGQQEAIRIVQDIFLILLDQQKAFRVIEEPEAHLYPMAQKHLLELIVLFLNQSDSQVVLTSHSPYILSILNNLLYAGRLSGRRPNLTNDIQEIIVRDYWLDPDKINVYFLRNGQSTSLINNQTGLIGQNFLDEISEELGADFEQLYRLGAKRDQRPTTP